jgi:glutathione synthase/RimK-type ligase-like ATP-grasp enzyme
MRPVIVILHPRDAPRDLPGVPVITARDYLADLAWREDRSWRVINLCGAYAYQSLGYYVSLLAEARGHHPLPRVATIEDLKSPHLIRRVTHTLSPLVTRSLEMIKSDTFELSIYFGRNLAARHDALCRAVFELFPAPLLQAEFERRGEHWQLKGLHSMALANVPPSHQDFLRRAAAQYLNGHRPRGKRSTNARYQLAILHDPANPEPPSNQKALQKFTLAGHALGIAVEFLTRHDFARLPEFDALFIRDTTGVNHYTYRFARRALAEGLVVIDDPESILKCNNKVYLAELLSRHHIPTPKTLLIHRDNRDDILRELCLPVVLKQPDSAFSRGVSKAENEAELHSALSRLLAKSDLVIAQEWLPTAFDWRVGVLDRRALFVARYYMVPGHWQIVQHAGAAAFREGPTVAVALAEAPAAVVSLGVKAANLIGNGFYGVDVKQSGERCCVIEVNDNPNVDAGNEDGVLKDALYREVIGTFLQRLEARGNRVRKGVWA